MGAWAVEGPAKLLGNYLICKLVLGLSMWRLCSCGDLDGEASLVVARRAPLVVAVGGSALSLPLRLDREKGS